jgi:hypothetical protein
MHFFQAVLSSRSGSKRRNCGSINGDESWIFHFEIGLPAGRWIALIIWQPGLWVRRNVESVVLSHSFGFTAIASFSNDCSVFQCLFGLTEEICEWVWEVISMLVSLNIWPTPINLIPIDPWNRKLTATSSNAFEREILTRGKI